MEATRAQKRATKEESTTNSVGKDLYEFQELNPQPTLGSYSKFIEGGRVIPEKFSIPLLYELERERERKNPQLDANCQIQ